MNYRVFIVVTEKGNFVQNCKHLFRKHNIKRNTFVIFPRPRGKLQNSKHVINRESNDIHVNSWKHSFDVDSNLNQRYIFFTDMTNVEESKIIAIGEVLQDEGRPLKERFRALFTLKNIGGSVAIQQIEHCFKDSSALLKHELAYCLGQMQDSRAVPVLIKVLKDLSQEPMVRHEAGEALGAIEDTSVIPVLEEYSKDAVVEVAETCQLALNRLQWIRDKNSSVKNLPKSPYASVDPAPPMEKTNIEELSRVLMDEEATLFDRYRAMFSLRNLRTKDSILALAKGLKAGSALFRHEIAFVLGQLQEEVSVPYLKESLQDPAENEMVRHECAEALGAIATKDCLDILQKYLEDNKRVVRESCIIALDMCEYENSPEFQYADTLTKVSA